ncbi:MAG: extracellular solute-binding protein [Chloroflexi bacterium]|nr:extracellular solute-binding protein [Chloroflexota bacterium]
MAEGSMAGEVLTRLTRRTLFCQGALAAGGAVLAACVGPGQQAPVATPVAAPVTLELWQGAHIPHQEVWKTLLSHWSAKNTNITINGLTVPDQGTKIQAAIAAGTVPDMQLTLNALTGMIKGFFASTDDIFRMHKVDPRKDILPSASEAWFIKGKFWGVPLEDGASFTGFSVREDLLAKNGLKVPDKETPFATWDELYAFGKKAVLTGPSPESTIYSWTSILGQIDTVVCAAMLENGVQYFDPNRGKWTFNNPGTVDIIKKLFYDPSNVLNIENTEFTNRAEPRLGATTSLRQGKVSMTWYGTGTKSEAMTAKEDAAPYITTYVTPPFKGTKRMPVAEGGWGVTLMKLSTKQDAAATFLGWLASDVSVGAIWNGYLACRYPPRAGQLTNYPDCQGPDFVGSRRLLRHHDADPSKFIGWESGGTIVGRAAMNPILQDVRIGKTSPAQAAQLIQEDLDRRLENLTTEVGSLK